MVISRLSDPASISLDLMRLILAQIVVLGHAASFNGLFPELFPPNFPWIQSIAVVGFVVSNVIAIIIAVPTEMKYHKLSKFLKLRFIRR